MATNLSGPLSYFVGQINLHRKYEETLETSNEPDAP